MLLILVLNTPEDAFFVILHDDAMAFALLVLGLLDITCLMIVDA